MVPEYLETQISWDSSVAGLNFGALSVVSSSVVSASVVLPLKQVLQINVPSNKYSLK